MAKPPARRGGQNVTILDPSREFEDIYDRMGQLMNLAMGDFGLARPADVPWSPLGDVSETDDAYQIQVELPGVAKDQVDIQVQDRELVISGEIKESKHGLLRRSSRRIGKFEFRTSLPGDIDPDQVGAQLSDGVLTVTVPKSQAAKPRRIEVSG